MKHKTVHIILGKSPDSKTQYYQWNKIPNGNLVYKKRGIAVVKYNWYKEEQGYGIMDLGKNIKITMGKQRNRLVVI